MPQLQDRASTREISAAGHGTAEFFNRWILTAKKKHADWKGTPMKSLVVAAIAVMSLAAPAKASVIPFLDAVTADGSNFKFSYTGQLSPDEGVTNGSRLVIVDFAGYVPGTVFSSLANVSASISNTLPAGLLLNPGFTDNPTIPDLVFTYTGEDFQNTGGPFPAVVDFAGLSAESTFGGKAAGSFSTMAVRNVGSLAGTADFNVGQVNVPSAVPEPATWAMMLIGFFGLGASLRRRRTTAVLTV